MPGKTTGPETSEHPVLADTGSDGLQDYLQLELRAACSGAIHAGTDPDVVLSDLTERLCRLRLMVAAIEADTPRRTGT